MTPENLTKLYDAITLLHQVRMATMHPTGLSIFDLPTIEPGTEGLEDMIASLRALTLKADAAQKPAKQPSIYDGMV